MASWIHKYKQPIKNTFDIFDEGTLTLIIEGFIQIAFAQHEN